MITVRIPGTADRVLQESSFRYDAYDTWVRYTCSGIRRKVGKGVVVHVSLEPADWYNVARYLASKEGALRAALDDVGDPSDRAEFRAVGIALDRILTGADIDIRRHGAGR